MTALFKGLSIVFSNIFSINLYFFLEMLFMSLYLCLGLFYLYIYSKKVSNNQVDVQTQKTNNLTQFLLPFKNYLLWLYLTIGMVSPTNLLSWVLNFFFLDNMIIKIQWVTFISITAIFFTQMIIRVILNNSKKNISQDFAR